MIYYVGAIEKYYGSSLYLYIVKFNTNNPKVHDEGFEYKMEWEDIDKIWNYTPGKKDPEEEFDYFEVDYRDVHESLTEAKKQIVRGLFRL